MMLRKKYGIIFAGDLEKKEELFNILDKIYDLIDGIKLGIIPLITNCVKVIKEMKARYELPIIVDLKLADIPYISSKVCKILKENGADYVIIHPFVGEEVLRECSKFINLFSVISMTHRGCLFNEMYNRLAEISSKYSYGFVLPANNPGIVKEIRQKYPDKVIISPGIIYQGAHPGDALKSGADFEIIGRAIYLSKNPREELERIISFIRNF